MRAAKACARHRRQHPPTGVDRAADSHGGLVEVRLGVSRRGDHGAAYLAAVTVPMVARRRPAPARWPPWPRTRCTGSGAAGQRSACPAFMWASTVVRRGVNSSETGRLSHPITATSSGTRLPTSARAGGRGGRSRRCRRTAIGVRRAVARPRRPADAIVIEWALDDGQRHAVVCSLLRQPGGRRGTTPDAGSAGMGTAGRIVALGGPGGHGRGSRPRSWSNTTVGAGPAGGRRSRAPPACRRARSGDERLGEELAAGNQRPVARARVWVRQAHVQVRCGSATVPAGSPSRWWRWPG